MKYRSRTKGSPLKRGNRKAFELVDQATAESGLRILQPCGCGVGQERRKKKEESANRNALDAGHPELIHLNLYQQHLNLHFALDLSMTWSKK